MNFPISVNPVEIYFFLVAGIVIFLSIAWRVIKSNAGYPGKGGNFSPPPSDGGFSSWSATHHHDSGSPSGHHDGGSCGGHGHSH